MFCFTKGRPWLFPMLLFFDSDFKSFFFTFLTRSAFAGESRIFGGCLGVSRAGWTTFGFGSELFPSFWFSDFLKVFGRSDLTRTTAGTGSSPFAYRTWFKSYFFIKNCFFISKETNTYLSVESIIISIVGHNLRGKVIIWIFFLQLL